MDKVFHSRIAIGQYLGALLIVFNILLCVRMNYLLLIILSLLFLAFILDRLFFTRYTITSDGRLIISYGHFSKSKELRCEEIIAIEPGSSMKFGKFAVMRFVIVRYGFGGKFELLLPKDERNFIKALSDACLSFN
ncbi:ABC transporter [Bacteroidaceae bacterium HV4-6-C5C]|jgi:hypothetical protein|nr:ABC transporter [Bacteroidaceae bacterium HV4-6-C5C]